ncbi:hypothetical protein TNCV_934261 [Trichonephila clavipes]|nr:hypothetical protein TNCV_934261 [Trichonephila clavipes]
MKAEDAILNNKASKENPQNLTFPTQLKFPNVVLIVMIYVTYPNLVLIIHAAPDASHAIFMVTNHLNARRANLNNTSTPPSGVNSVHELPSPINMCKDVTIFGRKLNGLVDTGSILTLLRNSTYINIDAPRH